MMERTTPRPAATPQPHRLAWRAVGIYLPVLALVVAAFLIIRNVNEGGGTTASLTTIDPQHAQQLNANIAFFEERVVETKDSLSYNKLTGFYLQRFREAGDTADIRRAELSATKSLAAAPDDYAGRINLALVKIVQHDFTAALDLTTKAKDEISTRPDAYAVLGDAQFALGKYAEATESYKFYLNGAPGFGAFVRQAALAEIRGNVPLAEQFWQAAIRSEELSGPENAAWARVQLGNLFATNGEQAKAKRQFEDSLRIYPGYHLAQGGLAKVAGASGDYPRAIALYQQSTARIPTLDFVVALGEVYERAGRPQDSARQYALVGAIGGLLTAAGVRSDLSLISFELDHGANPAGQVATAQRAYEERPSVNGADVYAWALYRAGRFDEARTKSDEALRLGTIEPILYFHAGMIAAKQGDAERAKTHLSKALAINPKFSLRFENEARETLKALEGGK